MSYILQAVATNGCAVVLLVTLLLNYGKKHSSRTKESKLFMLMIVSNLLQCVLETISVIIDKRLFPGAIPIATLINSLLFMNNIVFSYFWALYADVKISYENNSSTTMDKIKFLPALAIIICAFINLFTPVFFRITEENEYQRVGIYLVSYAVTYFYLILGTVNIYLHRKRTEKFTFLPVFTFLLPVCLASIVQYFVPGISLLWAGAAVGLSSAYMSLLEEGALTDKLSGLFSRHYLNQFLTTLPSRARDSKYILGIMMDVDDFKSINDTYGHLMGDDAIVSSGQILRKALPQNRIIFRYAGDEFVAIIPIEDTSEIEAIITKINYETEKHRTRSEKPYKLSFSLGHTTYKPGENPNTFLDRMDAEMYKNKKLNKRKRQLDI